VQKVSWNYSDFAANPDNPNEFTRNYGACLSGFLAKMVLATAVAREVLAFGQRVALLASDPATARTEKATVEVCLAFTVSRTLIV
jgi:hypothetical protein